MKTRLVVLICLLIALASYSFSQVPYLVKQGDNVLRLQLFNRSEQELTSLKIRFASGHPQWLVPKSGVMLDLAGYGLGKANSKSALMFDFPFGVTPSGFSDSEVKLELVHHGEIVGAFKVLLTFSSEGGTSPPALGKAGTPVNKSESTVEEKSAITIPTEYALGQNYPNPFNPATNIQFQLPENSWTVLKIYDLLGREIRTLINQEISTGSHVVSWDGTNDDGKVAPTGVYVYRLTTSHFVSTKKMIIVR